MDCSRQAPLSIGFSRQEYWSGLSCPSPGDLPNLTQGSRMVLLRKNSGFKRIHTVWLYIYKQFSRKTNQDAINNVASSLGGEITELCFLFVDTMIIISFYIQWEYIVFLLSIQWELSIFNKKKNHHFKNKNCKFFSLIKVFSFHYLYFYFHLLHYINKAILIINSEKVVLKLKYVKFLILF